MLRILKLLTNRSDDNPKQPKRQILHVKIQKRRESNEHKIDTATHVVEVDIQVRNVGVLWMATKEATVHNRMGGSFRMVPKHYPHFSTNVKNLSTNTRHRVGKGTVLKFCDWWRFGTHIVRQWIWWNTGWATFLEPTRIFLEKN